MSDSTLHMVYRSVIVAKLLYMYAASACTVSARLMIGSDLKQ